MGAGSVDHVRRAAWVSVQGQRPGGVPGSPRPSPGGSAPGPWGVLFPRWALPSSTSNGAVSAQPRTPLLPCASVHAEPQTGGLPTSVRSNAPTSLGGAGQPGPLSLSHSSDLKRGPPWVQGKDGCPPESVLGRQLPSPSLCFPDPWICACGRLGSSPGTYWGWLPLQAPGIHTAYKVPAPTELTDDNPAHLRQQWEMKKIHRANVTVTGGKTGTPFRLELLWERDGNKPARQDSAGRTIQTRRGRYTPDRTHLGSSQVLCGAGARKEGRGAEAGGGHRGRTKVSTTGAWLLSLWNTKGVSFHSL